MSTGPASAHVDTVNELTDEFNDVGLRRTDVPHNASARTSDAFVPGWADQATVAGDAAANERAGVPGGRTSWSAHQTNDLGLRKTGYTDGIATQGEHPIMPRVTGMGGDTAPGAGALDHDGDGSTSSSGLHAAVMQGTGVAAGTVAAAKRAAFGNLRGPEERRTLVPGLVLVTTKILDPATDRVCRLVFDVDDENASDGTGDQRLTTAVELTLDFGGSQNLELVTSGGGSDEDAAAMRVTVQRAMDDSGPTRVAELVVRTTACSGGSYSLKLGLAMKQLVGGVVPGPAGVTATATAKTTAAAKTSAPAATVAAVGAQASGQFLDALCNRSADAPGASSQESQGKGMKQVSFERGDVLEILEPQPGGLGDADVFVLVRNNRSGDVGLVPRSPAFVRPRAPPPPPPPASTTTATTRLGARFGGSDARAWGGNESNEVVLADGRKGLLMGSTDGTALVQIGADIVEVDVGEIQTASTSPVKAQPEQRAGQTERTEARTEVIETGPGNAVRRTTTRTSQTVTKVTTHTQVARTSQIDGLRVDPRSGKRTYVKAGEPMHQWQEEEVVDVREIPSALREAFAGKAQGGDAKTGAGSSGASNSAGLEAVDATAHTAYGEKMKMAAASQQTPAAAAVALATATDADSRPTSTFSLAQLQATASTFPPGVDAAHRERFLDDETFAACFSMDRVAFDSLPAWKRKKLKQQHGLF